MAEAAKQGWIPGGDGQAALHYADGVMASLETYGISTPAAYTSYMVQAGILYSPATGLQ